MPFNEHKDRNKWSAVRTVNPEHHRANDHANAPKRKRQHRLTGQTSNTKQGWAAVCDCLPCFMYFLRSRVRQYQYAGFAKSLMIAPSSCMHGSFVIVAGVSTLLQVQVLLCGILRMCLIQQFVHNLGHENTLSDYSH